ncbi:MAG TPA: DUF3822 family protein [Mucilaginibacter sp.]|nr:DUF3822 family protein [Mucilaginibacter sp.]
MSNRNHSNNITDLNTDQSAGYTLLVKIGLNSFSYAVTGQGRLLALKENLSLVELSQTSDSNNMLLSDYEKRIVSIPYRGFTFVPVSLFKPEKVADFARFLDVKPNEKVISQPLDADNQVIFKADEFLVDLVIDKFGSNSIVFAPKGWIKLTAANNPSNHQLYVNIDGDKAEFLNFSDGKLRFYNSFEFKAADELAYFAMLVTNELQLSPQDVILVLSGGITPEDENGGSLARFFGKVELNNMNPLVLPAQTTSHDILTLTALSLCGSSEVI